MTNNTLKADGAVGGGCSQTGIGLQNRNFESL